MPVTDPEGFNLQQALSDLEGFNPRKKGDAAAALGLHGEEEHIPLLKEAAEAESEYVRVSALYGLSLLGEKTALKDLLNFFDSSRKYARKLAITAWRETTDLDLEATPEDEDSCESAGEEAQEYWQNHGDDLTWDAGEKTYTTA